MCCNLERESHFATHLTHSRSPARSPGCTGSPDPRTGVCCSGRVLSWTRRSFRHLLRPKNRDRQRDPEMGSRPTRRSPTKTPKDLSRYSFDRRIEPKQLMGLLRQAGWANQRSIEGVRRMLEGTSLTLGAWEGDRLVGFARAMTDGIYRALIDDVPLEKLKKLQPFQPLVGEMPVLQVVEQHP